MIMSFDTLIAKEYGLLEATIIQNIFYWINKNKANDMNFFDGRYWTYNSVNAFQEQFIFASKDQIWRALKKLEDKGVLFTGNYNANIHDRTKWYALSDRIFEYLSGEKNEQAFLAEETPKEKVAPQKVSYMEQVLQIIDYLNQKTGKKFTTRTKVNNDRIINRLKDGYTIEDFKKVIDNKVNAWGNNDEMRPYLRPETLFCPTHFETYLNDAESEKQKRKREKDEINERQNNEYGNHWTDHFFE